ncbi:MAG TPA: PilN domain-containing protein [Balneolales bacterium]|nr:PilN domain-containing protein [Balneolales bacterium]
MSKKEFVGIALDGDILKVARVYYSKGKLHLSKMDRITLVDSFDTKKNNDSSESIDDNSYDELEADSIFGIDDDITSNGSNGPNDSDVDNLTDTAVQKDTDILTVADSENAGPVESNEMLIHNLMVGISNKRVDLGLNIPAGSTIFQIVKDQNHLDLKKKELTNIIDSKLESIYGSTKSLDQYAYEVREDGSLVLASNDNELDLLNLVDQSKDLYSGKVFIDEILPDEASLIGLVRNNYTLGENEITGIIQLGQKTTRLIFLRGSQVWLVSPIINEGSQSNHVLSTIFSKILFQLDTAELPSLERIVIANNVLGNKSISFFKKNFPDINVEDLQFDNELISIEPELKESARSFTTAIGLAWSAAGYKDEAYKNYSFLPSYVSERQKVFKLQWHGILLLALIALVPIMFNYVYLKNVKKINDLHNEILRTEDQIRDVRPLVIGVKDLSKKYNEINKELNRLDQLSEGSEKWSKSLTLVNDGLKKINSNWLTTLRIVKGGILIQGYSLYRSRIPKITNLFANAQLQDVHISKIRKKKVYKFTIMIRKVY